MPHDQAYSQISTSFLDHMLMRGVMQDKLSP